MLIEGGRLGRTQRVLVPGNVIAVGVRNERPRLPPAEVDRQVGLGQLQSVVPVEQETVAVGARRERVDKDAPRMSLLSSL